MSANAQRADILVRVLRAAIADDAETIRSLCLPDVRVWTPARTAATVDEIVKALADRDGVFSDIRLETTPLDVAGDHACVEWTANMAQTGEVVLRDGTRVEPTGIVVALHGVAVAEFDGERIASVRQYWDHAELFDQLGLVDQ
jgi:ketosteroid isomerase-like protein